MEGGAVITLEPFKIGHMYELLLNVPEPLGMPMEYLARLFSERGVAMTARDDGVLIGAAGLYIIIPGLADAWLMLCQGLPRRHQLFAARACKRWLVEMAQLYHLRRVQTHVDSLLPVNNRFIQWLGFEVEGRLRHYGEQDQDYVAYAWFPPKE
jgi:RimJ/RimL family protein N-acetyltransferase